MRKILYKITGINWILKGKTIYKKTNRLLTVLMIHFIVEMTILILITKYFIK